MPVKIVAIVTARPGHENEVESLFQPLIAGSRQEPGNLRYDLWRDVREGRFVVDELYVDHAATDAHRASAHYQAFRAALGDLLVEPPLTMQCDEVEVAA